MLYVPAPYSSGNGLSVCEDKHFVDTQPSLPTSDVTLLSGSHHKETSDNSLIKKTDAMPSSPPLTPKAILDPQHDDIEEQQIASPFGNDEGEDLFFLGQSPQQHHSEHELYAFTSYYSSARITDDNDSNSNSNNHFETANRVFHATINKFSRQHYPEYRKRTPYTFLENWYLHSMYSKSQQILLDIPHVHPTVLLSDDDFMFTPPLLQQDDDDDIDNDLDINQFGYLDQPMQTGWVMDNGQPFDDDTVLLDDGIVVMSAPDPPTLMATISTDSPTTTSANSTLPKEEEENVWIKNQVNFGPIHEQEQQQHLDYNYNNNSGHQPQDGLLDAFDKDRLYLYGGKYSEMAHWNHLPPELGQFSSIAHHSDGGDEHVAVRMNIDKNSDSVCSAGNRELADMDGDGDDDLKQDDKSATTSSSGHLQPDTTSTSSQSTANYDKSSPTSYQSLTDIIIHTLPSKPTSASATLLPPPPPRSLSSSSSSSLLDQRYYGSTFEQEQEQQYVETSSNSRLQWTHHQHLGLADQLLSTSKLVLSLASDYRLNEGNTALEFITCMVRIWQVLLLTAGMTLAGLWGRQQQVSSSAFAVNIKTSCGSRSVEPLLPV